MTSHVFRKTAGTVLDEAGLPITAIADQLGNSTDVAERHYRKRRVANKANARALEAMLDPVDPSQSFWTPTGPANPKQP